MIQLPTYNCKRSSSYQHWILALVVVKTKIAINAPTLLIILIMIVMEVKTIIIKTAAVVVAMTVAAAVAMAVAAVVAMAVL